MSNKGPSIKYIPPQGGGVRSRNCLRILWTGLLGKFYENLMKFGQILQNLIKFTTIEQRIAKCPQKLGFKTIMCHKYHHYL